jgi:hypothetical protein
MIAAANATSRAVVVVLFSPIVTVWAVVEGMTLLPLKGSGFSKSHVLPVRYIFYVFLFGCEQVVILFLTMTILRITAKEHQIHPLNHDEHWRP